jgi:hypothetical protein
MRIPPSWMRTYSYYGGGGGYGGSSVRSSDYLAFLVANGYQLAEVERVIVGERSGDEVYDDTLSAAQDTDPDTDEDADDPDDAHE